MKNIRKILFVSFLFIIFVFTVVWFLSSETRRNNQQTISTIQQKQTPSQKTEMPATLNSQKDVIKKIKYDEANAEQKTFLDKLIKEYDEIFPKDKVVLFYFNLEKNVAVVGSAGTDSVNSKFYTDNTFHLGFFHPLSSDENGRLKTVENDGLFFFLCQDVSSLSSSCSYVTDKYLVLIRDEDCAIFAYKAGDLIYDKNIYKKSTSELSRCVKKYVTSDIGDIPFLDTSFDGKKIKFGTTTTFELKE